MMIRLWLLCSRWATPAWGWWLPRGGEPGLAKLPTGSYCKLYHLLQTNMGHMDAKHYNRAKNCLFSGILSHRPIFWFALNGENFQLALLDPPDIKYDRWQFMGDLLAIGDTLTTPLERFEQWWQLSCHKNKYRVPEVPRLLAGGPSDWLTSSIVPLTLILCKPCFQSEMPETFLLLKTFLWVQISYDLWIAKKPSNKRI